MTAGKDAKGYQLTRVLKKSLDRRRAQNKGVVTSLTKFSAFLRTDSVDS